MSIQRSFLGWDRPFIPELAQILCDRWHSGALVDGRSAVIVTTGSRAGRRLLEQLVLIAESKDATLLQPKIVTAGTLPESLLRAVRPCASQIQRLLAWLDALQRLDEDRARTLLPKPPEKNDLVSWFLIAEMCERLYVELASARLSFLSVAETSNILAEIGGDARWEVLSQVKDRFQSILKERGLFDREHVREEALEAGEYACDGELILAGTADLSQLNRDIVSTLDASVESFVFAPDSEEASFDEFGCLVYERWQERIIPIPDTSISVVESYDEVGRVITQKIQHVSTQYAAGECTIGFGDEVLVPYIQQHVQEAGARCRAPSEGTLSCFRPLQFIVLAEQYLRTRSLQSSAALIRHPMFEKAVCKKLEAINSDWKGRIPASALDAFQTKHLQAQLAGNIMVQGKYAQAAQEIVAAIEAVLGDLVGQERRLEEWITPFREFTIAVFEAGYSAKASQEQLQLNEVLLHLRDWLDQLGGVESHYGISAADALHIFRHGFSSQPIPEQALESSIELLGWLELQMDDASVLALAGMNEGFVPESVTADPFLPDSVRSELGLVDNKKRYARDSFALTTMIHSKEQLSFVAARTTPLGDRLLPSRLLSACATEDLPERVETLYAPGSPVGRPALRVSSSLAFIPKPQEQEVISVMTATSFKDYLRCPYRFYLKHVLKLRELRDDAVEMDALQFGTFLHDILQEWGEAKLTFSNAEKLFDALQEIADSLFKSRFGSGAFASVAVQYRQAELRLRRFAEWQVTRESTGWKALEHEMEFDANRVSLKLVDGAMGVKGRIDRIDQHEESGQIAILDYKAGDAETSPAKHLTKSGWKDLQLPLYYHALRSVEYDQPIQLGIVSLSASASAPVCEFAHWTDEQVQSGIQAAKEIAQQVKNQVFWPPKERVQGRDEFEGLLGGLALEEEVFEGGYND